MIGATTGRELATAMNGACATMPDAPITALPTPLPRVMRVAGLAVAMKSVDENAADRAVAPTADPATAIDIAACGDTAFASET